MTHHVHVRLPSLLLAVVVSHFAVTLPALGEDPVTADSLNEHGKMHEAKGLLDEAFDDFTKAVQLDPTNAEAFFNRGRVSERRDNLLKSLGDFQKAIELDSDYAQAYAHSSAVRSALGQEDEAAKERQLCLKVAAAKSPPDQYTQKLLAAAAIAMQLGNDKSHLADNNFVSGPKLPGTKPDISSALVHWRRGHALALIALEHSVQRYEVGMPRLQAVIPVFFQVAKRMFVEIRELRDLREKQGPIARGLASNPSQSSNVINQVLAFEASLLRRETTLTALAYDLAFANTQEGSPADVVGFFKFMELMNEVTQDEFADTVCVLFQGVTRPLSVDQLEALKHSPVGSEIAAGLFDMDEAERQLRDLAAQLSDRPVSDQEQVQVLDLTMGMVESAKLSSIRAQQYAAVLAAGDRDLLSDIDQLKKRIDNVRSRLDSKIPSGSQIERMLAARKGGSTNAEELDRARRIEQLLEEATIHNGVADHAISTNRYVDMNHIPGDRSRLEEERREAFALNNALSQKQTARQLVLEAKRLSSGLPDNHPLHAQIEQMEKATDPLGGKINPPLFIRRE